MFARRLHQDPHFTGASSFFPDLTPIFYDGPGEIAVRKRRGRQRALRRWKTGVCASMRLVGWPRRGFPQSLVATVLAGTNPAAVGLNPVTNQVYEAGPCCNGAPALKASNLSASMPVRSSSYFYRSSITANLATIAIFLDEFGGRHRHGDFRGAWAAAPAGHTARADFKKRVHHRFGGFYSCPKSGQSCIYRSLLVRYKRKVI